MRPPRFSFFVLVILLVLAFAGRLLVTERPLWCRLDGQNYWPAWRALQVPPTVPYGVARLDALERDNTWHTLYPDQAVWSLVPFSSGVRGAQHLPPGSIEPDHPSRWRHWLGTDKQGRDVLACLVSGARTSVWLGLWAVLVALLVGGLAGGLAGFLGDGHLRLRRGQVWLAVLGLLPATWWAVVVSQQAAARIESFWWLRGLGIFLFILLIFNVLGWAVSRMGRLSKRVVIPVDLVVMRLAEVQLAVPGVILIFAIAALLPHRTLTTMVTLIGFFSWPGVARYLRAELLRIREAPYIEAARTLGFSPWRVLFRHALPNAVRPLLAVVALGIAEVILLEASLSFLGFGGSDANEVTWGRLLVAARDDIARWWVWLPTGLLVGVVAAAMFAWGERIADVPKTR